MPRDIFMAEFCPFRCLYPWEKNKPTPKPPPHHPKLLIFVNSSMKKRVAVVVIFHQFCALAEASSGQ